MRKGLFIILLFALPIASIAQTISGRVTNAEGEVLSYANVKLCQKVDTTYIGGTTTNHEGFFEIEVKDVEGSFLQVSYVGYQTQNIEIKNTSLVIVLSPILLGEITVVADKIKKDASSEVYYVTDSLRKTCANTLQLLDKLQGININWMTDAVKIGEYQDVPMLVDGRAVSLEYVRNLNAKRIRRIEVLRNPKGKYGDAPIVMNILLNNSYAGFDMSASAKGMLSLRNKPSHYTGEGLTMTYATKKWNLYGDAEFKDRRFFKAISYEQTYNDVTKSTAVEDYKLPNGSNSLTDLNFSIGMDYKLSPKHVVSLQTWVGNNKGKESEDYKDDSESFLSSNTSDYNACNITTGIYYRGSINDKLSLSSDVTYNYYDVEENKQYIVPTDISHLQYNGKKHFWRTNADARYVWNARLSSTIGYTFTKKDYTNRDRHSNRRLFLSEESRHDAYFNVSVYPAKNFNFVVGSNLLYIDERNDVLSDGNFSWMPLVKVYWRPFKPVSIHANYYCDIQHPNLDQLSTVAYQRNAILWHQGNPALKARVMHYMQYKMDLKDIVQITYLYKHSSNEMTPWYSIDGDKVMETLTNGDYVHQYIGLNGDYTLPHRIDINFAANYQWHKRRAEDHTSWRKGHTWYLDVTVAWQVHRSIALMSGYFLRYDKDPLLNGERYGQDEQLMLGARVSVLRNKLSIMLATTIPTNAVSKRTYSKIDIPNYQYITWNNEKVNNAIVQLSIRYNFSKGKVSKWKNANNSELEK